MVRLPWLAEILLYSYNTTLILFFGFPPPPSPPQILIVSISHNGLKQDNLPDVLSWVFFLHGLSIPLVLTECLNQPLGIKSNEQSC